MQKLFKRDLLPKSRCVQVAIIGELFDTNLSAMLDLAALPNASIASDIFRTSLKRIDWADQDSRVRVTYPPNCQGVGGWNVWP